MPETMTPERLEEIKDNWLGRDRKSGLAITGNAIYKEVAELISALETPLPEDK